MTIDINLVWFILVGVLFTGYAILDGFDLGVGILHLFSKGDSERRTLLNAIGPVWDGNEVWLVTGGGALFAAFPDVYATVFSGFYFAFVLLLFGLIFRAVAIEFRGKQPMQWWKKMWDAGFSISSIVCALLIGVALGNIANGIPLDQQKEFTGSFFSLLNPYSLIVGITTVVLFAMHGAIYLVMKTEGELHDRMRRSAKRVITAFVVCYFLVTAATWLIAPQMTLYFVHYPVLFLIPFANLIVILNIPREFRAGHDGRAFLSSCLSIVMLMVIFGIGMFPNLVRSVPGPLNSLTIYNASSSPKTLAIMLTIAAIGMPLVIAYTISIYWIFRGKVKIDPSSY